jgi:hypothetical protein
MTMGSSFVFVATLPIITATTVSRCAAALAS